MQRFLIFAEVYRTPLLSKPIMTASDPPAERQLWWRWGPACRQTSETLLLSPQILAEAHDRKEGDLPKWRWSLAVCGLDQFCKHWVKTSCYQLNYSLVFLHLYSPWKSLKTPSTPESARLALIWVHFELLSSVAKLICVTLINEHSRGPTWSRCLVNLSRNEDISLVIMSWRQIGCSWTIVTVTAVGLQFEKKNNYCDQWTKNNECIQG